MFSPAYLRGGNLTHETSKLSRYGLRHLRNRLLCSLPSLHFRVSLPFLQEGVVQAGLRQPQSTVTSALKAVSFARSLTLA